MQEKSKNIKSQDILILLKILSSGGIYGETWNTISISRSLYISQSEVSESLRRSAYAGFIESNKKTVFKKGLLEFLVHGIKYTFPVKPGPIVKGMPTAHSAPPLSNMIISTGDIYVWPYAYGSMIGQTIEPLYPSVPKAVSEDPILYEMLIFTDALRVGKAREKEIAKKELEKRIVKGNLWGI